MMDLADHPLVVEAHKHYQAAEQALATADQAAQAARDALEQHEQEAAEAICAGKKANGSNGHLEAIAEAESGMRVAQIAVRRAHADKHKALEAARAEHRDKLRGEYAAAVKSLDKALNMAAGANRKVFRMYRDAEEALGGKAGFEPMHWRELLDDEDISDSRLARWRAAAQEI